MMDECYQIYLVTFRTNAGGVMMHGHMLVFARNAEEASAAAEREVQRVIVDSREIVIDEARLPE
jgi:hypothetical protein